MIDLHVHSNYSDGSCTPTELVNLAVEKGLTAIALTDHDTVQGVAEALEAANAKDFCLIPGVELSVEYKGKEIHILGYHVDHTSPRLLHELERAVKERDMRNKKMADNLNMAGYPITYRELLEEYGNIVITRAHFAKLLLKNKGVTSIKEAFDTCLNQKSPYFVFRRYLTLEEAIHLIAEHGGIPVLAHPLLYKMSNTELNQLLAEAKSLGLQGVEAIYSANKGNDEAYVKQIADNHNLFITGGSDFHGTTKPDIELGTGRGHLYVDDSILNNIV